MSSINSGEFLWEIFNNFVSFFTKLYELLTYQIIMPGAFVSALQTLFPALSSWDGSISFIWLASGAGVFLGLILSIYYIIKGFL